MARRKRTPERSKIVRAQTPAFSRRQRSNAESAGDKDPAAHEPKDRQSKRTPTAAEGDVTVREGTPLPHSSQPEMQPPATQQQDAKEPAPPPGDADPDASDAARVRTSTVAMPLTANLGRPPEMPKTSAPPPLALGDVENPTHMPGPREVPGGRPEDPAPPPGTVPPGDSRSLRRNDEFALIYRVGTCVISRTGVVGTRGQWRVVEYPTSSAASNSYARECSRFVSDGFSDYRE